MTSAPRPKTFGLNPTFEWTSSSGQLGGFLADVRSIVAYELFELRQRHTKD